MREKQPRLSASGAKRDNACPAAFTRNLEYFDFLVKKGIDGVVSDDSATRGTDIHLICSKIPFATPVDFGGTEPAEIRPQVEAVYADLFAKGQAAKKTGGKEALAALVAKGEAVNKLSGFELYICSVFVEKRDAFINAVLDAHPGGRECVEEFTVTLDSERLSQPFRKDGTPYGVHESWPILGPDEQHLQKSGLPDMLVTVRGGGMTSIGVLDFKSGQQEYDPIGNPQVSNLLALAAIKEERLTRVAPMQGLASIVYEADLSGPVKVAKFSAADLEVARQTIFRTSKPAIIFAENYLSNTGYRALLEQHPALDADLDAAAKVGSHCLECHGKLCCGAIKMEGAKFEYALLHKYDHILLDAEAFKQRATNPSLPVNTATVSEVLHVTDALETITGAYAAMADDAAIIARQLHAKGEVIPNVEVSPGRKRVILNGETIDEVHEKVQAITGEDFDTFISQVEPTVKAGEVRKHLAAKLGKSERDVMALLDGMGAAAPIMDTFESPKVKAIGPKEDIVQTVAAEIAQRHKALEEARRKPVAASAAPAEIPAGQAVVVLAPVSVEAPAASAPVVASSTPPEAAPKKPRRPRKVAAPVEATPLVAVTTPAALPIEVPVEDPTPVEAEGAAEAQDPETVAPPAMGMWY